MSGQALVQKQGAGIPKYNLTCLVELYSYSNQDQEVM